ncbi:MAG: TolC family protein [Hyphomicrobiaceae bacterium]
MAGRSHSSAWFRLALLGCSSALAACTVSPSALEPDRLAVIAADKIGRLDQGQAPITGTVDLYEAMARALRYNLDHQVELAEQALRQRELDLAHYSLLPSVVAGSGYAARDKVLASSSQNVETGVESLATSTSQDRRLRTSDIVLSWNVLDFGLSYVRARQAADKVLIQRELRRKIALRILEDVRAAYWRAVSAQELLGRIGHVTDLARGAEAEARKQFSDRETSAITALTYERELVEIQRTLGELRRELDTALIQLGTLMNVKPGTRFRVSAHRRGVPPPPAGHMAELIHTAVMSRPELREVEYRKRINEQEAHAALLELLPGAHVLVGANYDSNSFLLHDNWVNWGARASWNLLKVFAYPARREVVEAQDRLLDQRSLAVTMAIMTQVYVSRARYAGALRDLKTASRYREVQHSLLRQIREEAGAGRIARQTLVREELNAIVADAKLDLAYAAAQGALANLRTSIGVDPVDIDSVHETSIGALAAALRSGMPAAARPEPSKEAGAPQIQKVADASK